jgi:hypothetical protein
MCCQNVISIISVWYMKEEVRSNIHIRQCQRALNDISTYHSVGLFGPLLNIIT